MKVVIEKYGKLIRTIESDENYIKVKCPVCGHENHIMYNPFKGHSFCDGYEIAIKMGKKTCMVEFTVVK